MTKPKPKEEHQKRGAPTAYKPEFAETARQACVQGATDREIANLLEIDISSLYRWKNSYPDFKEALKRGKEIADQTVADKLYTRATGYSFEAVKIFMPAGAKEPVYAPYTEHVPPDTTAMIFWLKNRRPDEWRDKREVTIGPLDMLNADDRKLVERTLEAILASRGKPAGGA